MSSYIVANITINDRDTYAQYEAGFMEIFERYQGRMLAVDDEQEPLEGDWPYTRTVLIEFPSHAAALEWYESEAYQALMQHRTAASQANIAIVSGMT